MDKDNKILLSAILIILVALVSFNFGDITGKIVKDSTVVAVSPSEVTAGEYITVYVNPGSDGVKNVAYVYRENDVRIPATINLCGSSKCEDEISVTYKILNNWDDNAEWSYGEVTRGYKIKVEDWRSTRYKTANFIVRRKYEAVGPAKYR